jgi:hypothetical protein
LTFNCSSAESTEERNVCGVDMNLNDIAIGFILSVKYEISFPMLENNLEALISYLSIGFGN